MKGVIETSGYALILAIICFVSIDFVLMNIQVTKVNEIARYIENYIEAKGYCDIDEYGEIKYYTYDSSDNFVSSTKETLNSFPTLNKDIENNLRQYINKQNLLIDFKYIDYTKNYVYIEYKITYRLGTSFLGYNKEHTYTGIAHFNNIGTLN